MVTVDISRRPRLEESTGLIWNLPSFTLGSSQIQGAPCTLTTLTENQKVVRRIIPWPSQIYCNRGASGKGLRREHGVNRTLQRSSPGSMGQGDQRPGTLSCLRCRRQHLLHR